MTAVYTNPTHIRNIMTFCAPHLKAEYLTECLIEVLNNQWKVDSIESGRSVYTCLLYTSPSPRDATLSRMPSSA